MYGTRFTSPSLASVRFNRPSVGILNKINRREAPGEDGRTRPEPNGTSERNVERTNFLRATGYGGGVYERCIVCSDTRINNDGKRVDPVTLLRC